MFVALQDIYIVIYLLLEQYIFERAIEVRMKEKVDFYLMVDQLKYQDCTKERDTENSPAPVVDLVPDERTPSEVGAPVIKREVSELDGEALDFLSALQNELGNDSKANEADASLNMEDEMYAFSDSDIPPLEQDDLVVEEPYYKQEDLLSIKDIHEEPIEPMDKDYQMIATAKISDDLQGPQQWIVNVVGVEGKFIHISDGSRLWLNVGEKYTSKIFNGDVLSIDVEKHGKNVDVKHIVSLETGISDDYSIPDEMLYGYRDLKEVI